MKKFKSLKNKVMKNKGKIILGATFTMTVIGGAVYVVVTNGKIKQHEHDIQLLKDVLSDDVINTLKETLKRKLRYHEGRLRNGIKNDSISDVDINLHKEEIEAICEQISKLNYAVTRIKS